VVSRVRRGQGLKASASGATRSQGALPAHFRTGVSTMELQDKLNRVFCEVFAGYDIRITPDMTANDVDGWDSLSYVNLIVATEYEFKITFSQKELLAFRNVGGFLSSIRSKTTT
jgi:acyl carrier protein